MTPEDRITYNKDYYRKHREELCNYGKEYRQENKKEIYERNKEYRRKNREKVNECHRKWYQNHKEEINKKRREHRKKYSPKKKIVVEDAVCSILKLHKELLYDDEQRLSSDFILNQIEEIKNKKEK